MSRPINPELTGPGICKNCGDRVADRPAKGLCRPCYDQQNKTADPFARAGLQQKAIDRAPGQLMQIKALSKKLRDAGLSRAVEFVAIQGACDDIYDRLLAITASDTQQQADEAMAELEVESGNMQPQAEPDPVEVDLRDIQPNPNPVEVEELPSQPQP